jgi:peroxiredoxin
MTGHMLTSKTVRFLAVITLIVSLTTACALEPRTQIGTQVNPEVALNSSSRLSAEIVKPGQSTDGKPDKKAAQGLTVDQPTVQPTDDLTLPTDPLATASVQLATGNEAEAPASPTQGEQPPAAPVVDLNLPVGPKAGLRAPDFTLQALDGKTYQLSSLAGQPVLINYWATWCIPCKAELPILQKLHQEYQQKGVVFISVDAIEQDSVDKIQALVGQFGMTFPVLLDKGAQFANLYGAMFFPTTILVDANGVIRKINLGDSSEADLRLNLDKLLAGGF